jgi:uncharacterized membrane protein
MTTAEFLKKEGLLLLLLLVPFVALPFIWGRLPDEVPIHWNIRGEPDNYAGKAFGLLLLPCINVGVYLLFWLIPIIDPKRKVRFHKKPIPALRNITLLVVTFLFFVIVAGMMDDGGGFRLNRFVSLGVIVLFLGIGNYMATVQPNYFIGIRTPWTLEDPEIWRKTHRLGGRLWVASSCVLLLLWLLLPPAVFGYVFLVVVLSVMVLMPVVYSYVLFARGKPKEEAKG